jgi:uncharacterized protein YaaR (DUF327 family)
MSLRFFKFGLNGLKQALNDFSYLIIVNQKISKLFVYKNLVKTFFSVALQYQLQIAKDLRYLMITFYKINDH